MLGFRTAGSLDFYCFGLRVSGDSGFLVSILFCGFGIRFLFRASGFWLWVSDFGFIV